MSVKMVYTVCMCFYPFHPSRAQEEGVCYREEA